MSFRVRGESLAFKKDNTEIKIGDIVAVKADGTSTLAADGAATTDAVAFYPALDPSSEDHDVASLQLSGVAKIKTDAVIATGQVVVVAATGSAKAIAGVVANKTAATYLGIAVGNSDGAFVPVLLGR